MKIACIGSRETTPELETKMEEIGAAIVSRGWYLGSGNARGSDAAYARGANRVDPTKVILYVVDARHNPQFIVKGNHVVTTTEREWERLAAQHHPGYLRMKPYVQGLMNRNAGIVRNADAVIAFLNRNATGFGGTGHGWRIAGTLEIPRLDISLPKNLARVTEFLDGVVKLHTSGPDQIRQ